MPVLQDMYSRTESATIHLMVLQSFDVTCRTSIHHSNAYYGHHFELHVFCYYGFVIVNGEYWQAIPLQQIINTMK